MHLFSRLTKPKSSNALCLLRIGPSMDDLAPVDDPQGLGAYQLAVDALIREQAPERIFCVSDNPADLSLVRKAVQYLAELGGEVPVAPQLSDEQVAEILGVDVDFYRECREDPDGPAGGFENG